MYEITKVITIDASREDVYAALTNSEKIIQYFPLIEVESEWLEGAEVLYKGEANGVAFTDFGVIKKLISPSLYTYQYWSDNHGTERVSENHITISYSLSKISEGTELTLRQTNIKSAELYELMEKQVWDYLLGSLKQYVEKST